MNENVEQIQNNLIGKTEFEVGQIVHPISNPSISGAIVGVTTGDPENRYSVFIDGATSTYYASQLQASVESDSKFEIVSLQQFHACLTALQIRYPGKSTLYSLNAARIDYIPYQFRPVLKFIRSDRPRLLIADDVGVGKTIEAGLILRELQARRDIKSVLIICPRPLVAESKWKNEMKRFGESFEHLDGGALRYCIGETDLDGVWPDSHMKAIIPYSLLSEPLLYGKSSGRNRHKGLLDLDPPPKFDLVIVDEAHHIRNTDTYAHKAVRFFCENAEAALFLTATPIQLDSNDLFVLLNVLRPDLIIDKGSFDHMAGPNPHLNRAVDLIRAQVPEWQKEAQTSLDNAACTQWGQAMLSNNPEFVHVRELLDKKDVVDEERIEAINTLEQLHTFSGIINRTRRRDIGNFTIRRPETVDVEFTEQQNELHDNLLDVQSKIMSHIHVTNNVNFMMTTIRRQAASCINGLAPMLKDILNRRINWIEGDADGYDPDLFNMNAIDNIRSEIQTVLNQAEQLDDEDPKLEALRKIISDKQATDNNKTMVFSTFRHTLSYLLKHLLADGVRVELVNGDTPDDERMARRNRFRLPKEDANALDVLLFSEVGCEGLDYQFCDCMVNYDLPWNPMKIEQRIGRIDRNGQKSETVSIYNMIITGTVDADIYERCLSRIGIFNEALGGSEEILGQITKEITNIAMNFELNEDERDEKLQQLADNKIRDIQEQQKLESKQAELFGIKLPANQMQREIDNASSCWLTPLSLQNLVTSYLQKKCGQDVQEFILGNDSLKTLRLAQNYRNLLLEDYHTLPKQSSMDYRAWKDWLKGGEAHMAITFDAAAATEHLDTTLITPLHPLVQQAALVYEPKKHVLTSVSVADNSIPEGHYPFAIYQWKFKGLHEDIVLRPISESKQIDSQLTKLIENGQSGTVGMEGFDQDRFDRLDTQHYNLWLDARAEHQSGIEKMVGYKRESLLTSHKARMGLLNEQLDRAEDEKIKRMRLAQITNAKADYDRRVQELDTAIKRADVETQVVAYGMLEVKNGSGV